MRLQALQRGRAVRRETAPVLRAALLNRELELGRAALPQPTRLGVAPRVETHPLSEACLLLKTRALKRLGAGNEYLPLGSWCWRTTSSFVLVCCLITVSSPIQDELTPTTTYHGVPFVVVVFIWMDDNHKSMLCIRRNLYGWNVCVRTTTF